MSIRDSLKLGRRAFEAIDEMRRRELYLDDVTAEGHPELHRKLAVFSSDTSVVTLILANVGGYFSGPLRYGLCLSHVFYDMFNFTSRKD